MKRAPKWSWAALALVVALAISAPIAVTYAQGSAKPTATAETTATAEVLAPAKNFVEITPAPAVTPTQAAPVPTVAPTPATPAAAPIGTAIVGENFSLVVDSVDVLDQIETVKGGPIVADPGTQLVLVHTTISITGNAQDLTCGSSLFRQAYDSEGSKMADVFEGPRIPGNPKCNYKTSAGETVTWNIAYKIAAGRTPGTISFTDTNVDGAYNWGTEVVAALR